MKRLFMLAVMGLALLTSCNESVKFVTLCDDGYVPKCIDDYHFAVCSSIESFEITSCCSDDDIRNNACMQICVNRDGGATCENISSPRPITVCGNNIIESGEECDGQNLNGNSCANRYGVNASGTAVCDPMTCKVRYDDCKPDQAECGDGVLNLGEDCDGELFGEHTCGTEISGAEGTLKCTSSCRFDLSGCYVDTCGNGQIDEGEACDTVLPDGLSCTDFIRESVGELSCNAQCEVDYSACHFPTAGDRCHTAGELNNGGCDEQGRHFFCQDGIIHIESCSYGDVDGVCGMFALGDDSWWAGCVSKNDICEKAGEVTRRCVQDSSYKTALNICMHDSVSERNYWIQAQDPKIEFCTYSCDRQSHTCAKLTSDEGTVCDDGMEPRCDGNIAVNCSKAKTSYTIYTTSCNEKCVVYELEADGEKVAGCVDGERDVCHVDDPDVYRCEGGDSVQLTCKSVQGENNGYLMKKSERSCANGCDIDTGECLKLYETEGKLCNNDYRNSCANEETLLYCRSNRVASKICFDERGNEGYCMENENGASCYEKCDEVGLTRVRCIDDSYTIIETCTDMNGRLAFTETEKEMCILGCDSKKEKCFKYKETDGRECDYETSTCDGNIITYCYDGVELSMDCSLYDMTCITVEEGYSGCLNSCSGVDQITKYCSVNVDEYRYETTTYGCMEDMNGKLYETPIDVEICSDGCNETQDACVNCNSGDIESVCTESNEMSATFYMQCQDNGEYVSWEYIMDGEGYVYDLCPAGCNDDETACKQVFDTHGDECDADSYIGECIDGFATSCSNSGHVVGTSCENGESCHVSSSLNIASCTSKCNRVTPVQKECMYYPEYGGFVYVRVCEAVDGNLYQFSSIIETCSNGCNKDKTGCL